MKIEIAGKKYKVTDNLGFSHNRGEYAKAVMTEHGERIAVKAPYRGARWRFSKPVVLLSSGYVGQADPINQTNCNTKNERRIV
jgi:hypothetical protein